MNRRQQRKQRRNRGIRQIRGRTRWEKQKSDYSDLLRFAQIWSDAPGRALGNLISAELTYMMGWDKLRQAVFKAAESKAITTNSMGESQAIPANSRRAACAVQCAGASASNFVCRYVQLAADGKIRGPEKRYRLKFEKKSFSVPMAAGGCRWVPIATGRRGCRGHLSALIRGWLRQSPAAIGTTIRARGGGRNQPWPKDLRRLHVGGYDPLEGANRGFWCR